MNLDKLITDCQVKLFNRLNLNEHFNLRATCRSLNDSFLVSSATRHSFVLKLGSDQKATNCNDLVFFNLNRQICNFLLATFPNIKNLEIRLSLAYDRIMELSNFINQIAYLLNGWSDDLVSLQIFNQIIGPNKFDCQELWQIFPLNLNRLSSLKVLHLPYNPFLNSSKNSLRDQPILKQLEEFSFSLSYNYNIESICNSLVKYAQTNDNLRTISLNPSSRKVAPELAQRFLNFDPAFTCKFTSLGDIEMTGQQLAHCASKFTALKSLNLRLTETINLPLHRVSALLSTHMPQLESLYLHLDFNLFPDNPLPCTPLPSVKTLKLDFAINDHTNIAKYLQPSITFPNLIKASTDIDHWKCRHCRLNFKKARINCRKLLERPFKKCTKFIGPVLHDNQHILPRIDQDLDAEFWELQKPGDYDTI